MPWSTPTLRRVREMVRDEITAALSGAVLIGNNVLRVMADAMAGLAHLNLRFIDWLALQLMPDTAETVWLDRHGDIWLTNSDGSLGRKVATYAEGIIAISGTVGTTVPQGTVLTAAEINYETTEEIILGSGPTDCGARALDPGTVGNLDFGTVLSFVATITGADSATVQTMTGGTDTETDEELRQRVLIRIRQPPAGGDAGDFLQWTLAVPGVTRAWVSPLEMGMGSVTIRFMCDDLRATNDGFPLPEDIERVESYIDQVRPVAIKDRFVLSPLKQPVDCVIHDLDPDTSDTRAAIEVSIRNMLRERARPAYSVDGSAIMAQTIYSAWVSEAISNTYGVYSFTLEMDDVVMPSNGHMGVVGTIAFD